MVFLNNTYLTLDTQRIQTRQTKESCANPITESANFLFSADVTWANIGNDCGSDTRRIVSMLDFPIDIKNPLCVAPDPKTS